MRAIRPTREYRTPSARRAVTLGAAVTVISVLPAFLVAALAVQITADLAFGTVGLGIAVGVHRISGAATAPYLGRLADRLGATRSIRLAALTAIASTLGIALTATRWAILAIWLAVAGVASALGQPAANRLLSNFVPPSQLGTAFGLKQSAPPVAAMLAGVSVPLLGVTVGWRWAFAVAAVLALAVVLLVGPLPPARPRPVPTPPSGGGDQLGNRRPLIRLTAAFAFATLSSSTATAFYVDSAVRAGTAVAFAGTILAVASAAAVAVRILAGVVSDRLTTGHLRLCGALVLVGAGGLFLLALGGRATMAAGVVIALAGTWGFSGIFWYALVRAHPETPGQVTGIVFPGALVGGTAGPVLFGWAAAHVGYPVAWGVTSLLALVAAGLMNASLRGLGRPSTKD